MRWTAFLSIFVEIFLKLIAKPLKKLGSIIENFLNSCTQRDNKDYYSIFGFIDTRFDLDKKIQHGDAKYYPALSMMASKLAYENQAVVQTTISERWKMDFVDFYNFYNEFKQKSTTQAFIFHNENIDEDMIVVAFRGTSLFSAEDWSTDFNYAGVKIEGIPGKTHFGYMLALGLNKYSRDNDNDDYLGNISGTWPKQIEQDPKRPLAYYTLREKLKEMMSRYENAKIIVTGHSFGGALAVLFPAVLALHGEVELLDKLEGIYTYGQPRVGDGHFGHFMKNNVIREHNIKYYRIVYGYDIVPQLPPRDDAAKSFKHFGTALRFNSFYHGKVKT
ncbi:hypothetical protein SOVF_063900 [Spinacia oleracea]|nr:hypothetical protein SOVF_063900 [Spinacia oleracea]